MRINVYDMSLSVKIVYLIWNVGKLILILNRKLKITLMFFYKLKLVLFK